MHLVTEMKPDGIYCTYADAGKNTGELFCVISYSLQDRTWNIIRCPMKTGSRQFYSLKAIEYFALALAFEYLAVDDLCRDIQED